ncbi:hypothetical protein AX14_013953 [Amanita brunnescens Koide BX004]|nr:hypothetical protein AX14_013953 [Amanita brunnescens Koide BX004]
MSFSNLTIETPGIWGQETPQSGDFVRDAIRKEAVIKEILASQEDLRSMSLADRIRKRITCYTSITRSSADDTKGSWQAHVQQ